jgi:PIN domain nuclease of toxin-antitoxin system
MRLLLDTHALLWFIAGSPDLSSDARTSIEDPANEKLVSIASIWETAIKVSVGKMTLSAPFDDLFPHQLQINGFDLLPIRIEHAAAVSALPFHHRDPFDRLLAAQAIKDNLALASADNILTTTA